MKFSSSDGCFTQTESEVYSCDLQYHIAIAPLGLVFVVASSPIEQFQLEI